MFFLLLYRPCHLFSNARHKQKRNSPMCASILLLVLFYFSNCENRCISHIVFSVDLFFLLLLLLLLYDMLFLCVRVCVCWFLFFEICIENKNFKINTTRTEYVFQYGFRTACSSRFCVTSSISSII